MLLALKDAGVDLTQTIEGKTLLQIAQEEDATECDEYLKDNVFIERSKHRRRLK